MRIDTCCLLFIIALTTCVNLANLLFTLFFLFAFFRILFLIYSPDYVDLLI